MTETENLSGDLIIGDVLCEIGSFFGLRNIYRLFSVCKFWKETLDHDEFFERYFMNSVNVENDYKDKSESKTWKQFVIERFHPHVRLQYQDDLFCIAPLKIMKKSGVLEEIVLGTLDEIKEKDIEFRNPRKGYCLRWKLSKNYSEECISKFLNYMLELEEHEVSIIVKPLNGPLYDCLNNWEITFLRSFVREEGLVCPILFGLISISDELNVRCLLDLTSAKVADRIRGKTTEEMREILGIVNDFTPEEEARIKEENRWIEEN